MNNNYLVKKAPSTRDEFLSTDSWKDADVLTDFIYPWENDPPPPMTFRALHDDVWLHCFFEVNDSEVKIYSHSNEKTEVIYGDRVEIFFRQDENMNPYYCLEVDPSGRVYDYVAVHYRQFDPAWSWPAGHMKVKTSQMPEGYSVYLMITLKSLEELGLLQNHKMEVGLFRGKCLQAYPLTEEMRWISWIKPHSSSPDFHISSAFGFFRLL